MVRVLGGAAWCCSVLAVVCLVLGVLAAPVGVAKADEPGSGGITLNCGGYQNGENAVCNVATQPLCLAVGDCRTYEGTAPCKCKWGDYPVDVDGVIETMTGCGCSPKP